MVELRHMINAKTVYWVLPSSYTKPNQRTIVEEIARSHKDKVIDIKQEWLGSDKINLSPEGYQSMGSLVR